MEEKKRQNVILKKQRFTCFQGRKKKLKKYSDQKQKNGLSDFTDKKNNLQKLSWKKKVLPVFVEEKKQKKLIILNYPGKKKEIPHFHRWKT